MMITVPEAARKLGRNPETVRRWIRSGKLGAQKVGTQYLVDEDELLAADGEDEMLPVPGSAGRTFWGAPRPNVVRWIRISRQGH